MENHCTCCVIVIARLPSYQGVGGNELAEARRR